MVVEIRLFARFREGRFKQEAVEFPDGSSVGDVLAHLGIPAKSVGMLLVNGKADSVESKLGVNDVVSAFPAIGGG